MLGDSDAMATIAVKDLERARKFYEGTLGLKRAGNDQQGVVSFKSGKTVIGPLARTSIGGRFG